MKLFGNIAEATGVVFDIDKTIYPALDTLQYRVDGEQAEREEIARLLNVQPQSVAELIAQQMQKGCVTVTESVGRLGISASQWSELRQRAWRPEDYFCRDAALCYGFTQLARSFSPIVFATNAPQRVGERLVEALGVFDAIDCQVFGPESLGCSKPSPSFFLQAAKEAGLIPAFTISVGDREKVDILPALAAGYVGGVLVNGRDEVIHFFNHITRRKQYAQP